MRKLLIAGGGITGLAAAWQAEQDPRVIEIVLVERENRLGGKILSDRVTEDRSSVGYLFEGGPESFLSRKRAAIELCEALGIERRLIGTTPRTHRSFVSHHKMLYPVPQGFTGLVPGDPQAILESDLLSEEAKERFLREPTIPPNAGGTDESVAAFMTRRFGREIFDRIIEPLATGIYAGSASLLSMAATFPHLQEQERKQGSLLQSAMSDPRSKREEQETKSSYPPFVSFPDGMEELVRSLQGSLRRTVVQTGRTLVSVQSREGNEGIRYSAELDGEQFLDVDAIIFALPTYDAAPLLAGIDPVLAEALGQIKYASTAIVHLAFRAEDASEKVDGYGYVVPEAEADTFLACTWSSSKWEQRAPDGRVLIRLYAGRYGNDNALKMSDRDLVLAARREISATLGIDADPVASRVYRWERAIPQYNLGHVERVAKIRDREVGMPGIFLAGAPYDGIGIPNCIASGENAARRAAEYLR